MVRKVVVRSALSIGLAAGLAVGFVGIAGPAGAGTPKPKAPKAPTGITVKQGNAALTVSWTAPAPGTSPITGYTTTASSKGLTTETCATTGATSCIITGIVNPAGKAKNQYSVSVTATNSVGTGKAGKASGKFAGTDADNCSNQVPYANLSGCDLTGGRLIGADLTGANLSDANLSGVNLTGDGEMLAGVNLTGANLAAANFTNLDFTGANLTGATISSIFDETSGAYDGGGNNFTNAVLTNADLDAVDMSTDTLTGVISGGITGTPSALPTGWLLDAGYLVGDGANLSGAQVLLGVQVGDVVTGAVSVSVLGFGSCSGTMQATVETNPTAPGVATLQETSFDCPGISLTGNTLTISDSAGLPVSLSGSTFEDGICSSESSECTLDTETGSWSNADDTATMTGNIVGPFGGDNPVTAFVVGPVVDTSLPGSPGVIVN